MAAALDHVVDSLASRPQQSLSGAVTASGESPGVTSDYRLDVPLEHRPSFAKSAGQDGGLVILDAPNPHAGSSREVLLAASQDNAQQGTVVMRPRAVEQMRGEGKARRGSGVLVNPSDVGLAMQPIMIQRQADVDDTGHALDPEAIRPQLFLSDGTVAGARRIDEAGSVVAQPKVATEAILVAAHAPAARVLSDPFTPAAAPLPPARPAEIVAMTPKQRLVYEPPSGGKIRASADDVIISEKMILVISDASADTSYEPAPTGKDAPIKLGIGTEVYEVMYGGWCAEKGGKLYLVFIRIPKDKA